MAESLRFSVIGLSYASKPNAKLFVYPYKTTVSGQIDNTKFNVLHQFHHVIAPYLTHPYTTNPEADDSGYCCPLKYRISACMYASMSFLATISPVVRLNRKSFQKKAKCWHIANKRSCDA